MTDYDSNLISPVQGLQNLAGIAPAKRRKDGSRRRETPEKEQEPNKAAIEDDAMPQERSERADDPLDNTGIDYCA